MQKQIIIKNRKESEWAVEGKKKDQKHTLITGWFYKEKHVKLTPKKHA